MPPDGLKMAPSCAKELKKSRKIKRNEEIKATWRKYCKFPSRTGVLQEAKSKSEKSILKKPNQTPPKMVF